MKDSVVYRQAVGVEAREADGEIFLAGGETAGIYHLNVLGSAYWRMIETPASQESVIGVFQEAFPEQSSDVIRRDLETLIADLETKGLIVRA